MLGAVVLGAALALLAVVAFPGIGFGETTTSHGLTPGDVYASSDPGVCNGEDKVGTEPASLLPTAVHVSEPSLLVASFTSTWSTPGGSPTELLLGLQIEGDEFSDSFPGEWITNAGTGLQQREAHGTGTVAWPFSAVPPGDYTVWATAHIAGYPGTNQNSGANLQGCALTVLVSPMA